MIRLGEVGDGLHRLGTVEMNKFLVLVTAEEGPPGEERRGPVMLRARSPSMRLQPHDVPFAFLRSGGPGARDAAEDETPAGAADGEAGGEGADAADGAGGAARERPAGEDGAWTPPMGHPEIPMVPPLASVLPSTGPLLPTAERPEELPEVRGREVVPLADGDTLRLTARKVRRTMAGRTLVMYGFNGRSPGPLLRVPQGATVTVRFRNELDLPTTVHWHGVRLDNRFDGVAGITQAPVEPGGSFTYRVRFPDAGLYWYHPHVREDVQQDLGLYGNMLVEPRPPEAKRGRTADLRRDPAGEAFTYGGHFGPVNREEVVMLDDLLLAGEAGDRLVPYGRDVATHALMGRFGTTFLVNGEPDYRLEVDRGEVVRFWITNVASTRTFNLSFGDLPVKVVASDLSRFRRPVRSPNVVLGPAERYAVEVRFDEAGTVPLVNRVQALDHVYGSFFPEVDTLGTVRVREGAPERDFADAFGRLEENPEVARDMERYRDAFEGPPDRELHLGMEAEGLPFPVDGLMRKDSIYFHPVEMSGTMPRMNWVATSGEVRWILRDPATGAENMAIDWRFRVGDVVRLRLRNLRHAAHAMQHPIHIHGQRFLVLSRNGRPAEDLVWKDTTIVPVGTTATLLLELTNPGEWMIHCHIAEHLDSGMRMTFTVDPAVDAGSDP
jgi:FtsP/CotA-like multicopper oxidase with cupredoxin domain